MKPRHIFQLAGVALLLTISVIGVRQQQYLEANEPEIAEQAAEESQGVCNCGCAEGRPCTCPNCPLNGGESTVTCDHLLETYAANRDNIEAFNQYFDRTTIEKILAWEEAGCPATFDEGQASADVLEDYFWRSNGIDPADVPDLLSELDPTPAVETCSPEPIVEIQEPIADPVDVPLTHDASGYLTADGIQAWLSQHSVGRSWSYGGGNYGEPLRNHLIRTHGWRESQLLSLSDAELRELHSAAHEGELHPQSDVAVTVALAGGDGIPVFYDSRDDYWHWRHNGREYRWHTLIEGQTYGERFLFEDGAMSYVGRDEPPAVPVSSPAPVVRIQSSGGCPNGQCGRPMRFGRRWR